MPDEEWIKTLADGRRVKFIYQELPVDGAFITAQLAGNEVVYSVVTRPSKRPAVKMSKAILRASFQKSNPTGFGTLCVELRSWQLCKTGLNGLDVAVMVGKCCPLGRGKDRRRHTCRPQEEMAKRAWPGQEEARN